MATSSKGKQTALFLGAVVLLGVAAAGFGYHREIWFWCLLATRFERLANNAQGYPEYRDRQTGIVFVRVPGGKFLMGSPETEEGRDDNEGPVHEVELSAFLIGKYELTQGEWERVIGSNPSHFSSKNGGGPSHPVENVGWNDAQSFCAKVGLKLPSEAQWEYACRGPETAKGGSFAGTGDIGDLAWYRANSVEKPHFVGTKRANGFGLHDMHGNVWEMCEDNYSDEFYKSNSAKKKDCVYSTLRTGFHVRRGGSWEGELQHCRSAERSADTPGVRLYSIGFRTAFYPLP